MQPCARITGTDTVNQARLYVDYVEMGAGRLGSGPVHTIEEFESGTAASATPVTPPMGALGDRAAALSATTPCPIRKRQFVAIWYEGVPGHRVEINGMDLETRLPC